jgi:CheY-like chemotaxis protein
MIKILYVEDNEDNIYMLTRRLTRKGYEVITAGDGREGIARAKSDGPALILMDLSLPVMDGWTATRALKADATTRHIPVIALSAHAMDEHRDKAMEAGCDDYDTKPVEIGRLISKIEALIGA